jgi:hypothetical protein
VEEEAVAGIVVGAAVGAEVLEMIAVREAAAVEIAATAKVYSEIEEA